MSSLDAIPVVAEGASTGNVRPLLHEIRHALEKLLNQGEATLIDLHGLPLSEAERQSLLEFLGEGEVRAELASLGKSLIWETGYAGVWVVEHFNSNGAAVARHIAVTKVPDILISQSEDILADVERLQEALSSPAE